MTRSLPARSPGPLVGKGLSFVAAGEKRALYFSRLDSPIGTLTVVSDGAGLSGLSMEDAVHAPALPSGAARDDDLFSDVKTQLEQYFAGERQDFDLLLSAAGTAFQRAVWQALTGIGYGSTSSYAEIARAINKPQAYRAVGNANGRNPIAVIVPCHRVIAADGSLGGYGGGAERKELLLALEAKQAR